MRFWKRLEQLFGTEQASRRAELASVFFLRTRAPIGVPGAPGQRTLMVVRSSAPDPYLAVSDAELGRQIVAALGVEDRYEVVRGTELAKDDYFDFSKRKAVLLTSKQEVEQFLTSRATFPYASRTVAINPTLWPFEP